MLLQAVNEVASVDAFIVIFSVTDDASFLFANSCIQAIQRRAWKAGGRSASVILVANKNDLVRNRIITDYGKRSFTSSRPGTHAQCGVFTGGERGAMPPEFGLAPLLPPISYTRPIMCHILRA